MKVKFKWTKKKTFNEIKRIVAHDNLLTYTEFNKEFKIHTDDSDFKLGAVIIHKVKLIALHIRKLTGE